MTQRKDERKTDPKADQAHKPAKHIEETARLTAKKAE